MAYLEIDLDDIADRLDTDYMLSELSHRIHRKDAEKIKKWCRDQIKVKESINGDNLIDDFKIAAFKDAMNRLSLDEIEQRLKA